MLSIPTKRNFFLLVFLPAWLVGWAMGWGAAFSQLTSSSAKGPPELFLVAWLVAWTAGGVFAIWALAWSLAGREVVTLRPHELVIARKVLGLGRARQYAISHVANLRVAPEGYNPFDFRSGMRFWGIGGGLIDRSTAGWGSSAQGRRAGRAGQGHRLTIRRARNPLGHRDVT